MNKWIKPAVLLLFVMMIIIGCATPAPAPAQPTPVPATQAPATKAPAAPATQPPAATQPTQAPSAAQPKKGGTLNVGLHQEPDRLWGPITGLTVAQEVAGILNESLIKIDEKLNYVPALVEQVPTLQNGGISADGLTFTFKLRKDVKWHDGTPFTSKDIQIWSSKDVST